MSQSVKTLVFAGVALLSLGVGFATHRIYKPADLEGFSDVGMEFFPEFTDPNAVTGLRVASFNEETGQTDLFSVQFKDGTWRIPSHHDYPADGEDQLSTTAASMIGVERQALVERTKAAHKRYRLLDPLEQEDSSSEGFGDRITLTKGEEVVADFIVGMPVEGQENTYYVRAAGEDRFYTANLGEFEISTKFSDWILKDILDIDRNNVNELIVDRYQVDEARGVVVQGDRLILNRDGAEADWQLEGLDGATEELNATNINEMLLALDDLSIVGVRKKPDGISADLKAEEGVSITAFDMLDLQDKGFFIDQRQGRILSNEGEVLVGTNDGVLYVLRFGEEFTGTDVDIEVGKKAGEGEDSKESSDEEESSEESSDEKEEDEEAGSETEETSDDLTKSRYLFVTAQFDPALLGEKPTPPVKPEPPAQEADAEKSEDAAADSESDAEGDANAEQSEDDNESNDEASKAQKEYKAALARYEEDQEVYEIALRDYEEKLKAGEERVVDLNHRCADWYYVIGADVFDRMKLNRTDLVEAKEVEESNAAETAPETTTPAEPEMTKPETPQESTPEETKSEPEASKPEAETAKPEAASESEAEAKDSPPAEDAQDESADSERPPQPDLPEESPKNSNEGNSSEEPASTEPTADESGASESSESTGESSSEEGTNESEAENSESDSDS
ncbi:hypothetical protein KOR42_27430 [Thalassoglobus neptunius]|uniref:DUF4340 domain-containing protein n=1 Tax=Thalassoglobus neptunius TaxID=1938619 RepID=A0A5C5WY60_9PLAN|nr:DUF4340 domain-containing protein [Thalassoglobus neptunius]TWT55616.1 hypothetical protein KOR42_27430 [Thalassoglobus neptunius]